MLEMAFSEYLADKVLNWIQGSAFPTQLSNVYISVHTGVPGDSGLLNDVTSSITGLGSNFRATVSAANLSAPTAAPGGGRQVSNGSAVTITSSAANAAAPAGVTLTHFGIWDSAGGGNFLGYGVLSAPVTIFTGDTVQFAISALVVRVI